MTPQPGKKTITIHILPYISGSKDNQTVKFGQLIKYNMRKIFLEKSYTKCSGETSPKPFSKISKLSISLDFTHAIHIVCQVEGHRNILKLNCRPLALTSYKAF